ncbi:MAG TPA: selenocysteine-specific translation elongation factor [Chthoniobacterales bacterium]|nr:selenocysteine-specific translation elongation factor [Chthoniobacterales bacterium]
MKHFILATAGHVDHGKSALVKALTGIDPDRLPEEKARGITIELGFAQLTLTTPEESMSIGIVDVPGHEDFIKNMVAGVGSIDLALLVVAADDGWMPQTEEHFQILTYLGVRRAVIALTKIDLATSEDVVEAEVRAQLAGTQFRDAPIVRTSVTSNRGIEELKAQLVSEFASLSPPVDLGKPRLAVDRAFTLRGIGTVVTGTLTGGTFRRSDVVVVQPANIPTRIRAIQSHNREVAEIGPGARTALNLADLAVARKKGERGVWRGDVVTLAEFGDANAVINVALTRSSRLPPATRPLKNGTTVRVHHASANSLASIFFQSGEELKVTETGIAQLRFDAPVFMFAGDRFVVRDVSDQNTLAGGIVLEPDATARNFRSAAQRDLLERRMHSPKQAGVFVETQLIRDRVAARPGLLIKSHFSRGEIAAAIFELGKGGQAIESGDLVYDTNWWRDFRARAVSEIEREHTAHPNRVGLPLSRLRTLVGAQSPLSEAFDALVSELCQNGFARSGDVILRATHRPTLPDSLQSAGSRIRAVLAAKPFDPPSRKDFAPDALSQQALRFLCDTGEVVKITDDLFLGSDGFAKMRDAIVTCLRGKGSGSMSDLRQTLASSRRVIVPFLERLDRDGVTRRIGDKRTLAP